VHEHKVPLSSRTVLLRFTAGEKASSRCVNVAARCAPRMALSSERCKVNDSVVRLGVMQGEYHWHKHDDDDEFFFVLSGTFIIDLEGRSVALSPQQGFVVPKGVIHRTRAPEKAVILMVETATIVPTGDA
jgi:mannose-6-phosphate isomerase-like protein (cupin superfamily)